MNDDTHDDDAANDDHEDLQDEFGRELAGEAQGQPASAPATDPAIEPGPPVPRLAMQPSVDLSTPRSHSGASGLMVGRSADQSPVRLGEAHTMMALLWVYRFGFSTREVLDALRGTKGDGVTKSLIARGLLQAFPPKNPTAIQAKVYVCLTEAGVAAVEEWSVEWESVADEIYTQDTLPGSYTDWVRISLLPPEARYHCLGGRIRHARAQHDLQLQRWFLRVLLDCEACEPWGIRAKAGAVLPINWGPIGLRSWRFADEIESLQRQMNVRPLQHIPDLELHTEFTGGNVGLTTIEIELENARKRQDEVDAQVLRSALMYRDGRHLDEVTATRHTVILSTNNLLTQQWIRAFARDAVPRWKTTDWRKRVPDGASRLVLPAHWHSQTSIAWNSQVLQNIPSPASLVKLYK